MTTDAGPGESFEAFKDSFSYGSRTDLTFKFLKRLSAEDAARFFQGLLGQLGETCDDGRYERLVDLVCDWQRRAYAASMEAESPWVYADGPFTRPDKPVGASRLGLLSSSGHFVDGDDPRPFGIEGMTQEEAVDRIGDFLKIEPALSAVPVDTPGERLRVRHGGYDIRGAEADPNVVFPLDRLRELQQDGAIGWLASPAYSFVGACAQTPLLKHAAPAWVARFREQRLDAAVLVPV
jgi:D-proline reductase (dithiol) PrdB